MGFVQSKKHKRTIGKHANSLTGQRCGSPTLPTLFGAKKSRGAFILWGNCGTTPFA
jgi:hypothetical protein